MCINPNLIKNPNFGLKNIGLNYLKDCSSAYLRVPCGHCPECVHVRQMGIVQRMNVEYKYNHLLFVMLSYKPNVLPVLTLSNGWKIPFASWKDLQDMFKRLRKRNAFGRPFRYLAVSERGEKGHRPHFHIILIIKKNNDDDPVFTPINLQRLVFKEVLSEWKRNVATRVRKKDGKIVPDNVHPRFIPLLEYHRCVTRQGVKSNYTVEYIRPLSIFSNEDAVSFYISKYVLKEDDFTSKLRAALELNLDEVEYKDTWSVVRPRCKWSHGFGLDGWPTVTGYRDKIDESTGEISTVPVVKTVPNPDAVVFVHKVVSLSVPNGSPQFLAENGSVYPLSRYYYRFGDIIDPDLAERFKLSSGSMENDNVIFFDKSPDDIRVVQEQFNKVQSLIKQNSKL